MLPASTPTHPAPPKSSFLLQLIQLPTQAGRRHVGKPSNQVTEREWLRQLMDCRLPHLLVKIGAAWRCVVARGPNWGRGALVPVLEDWCPPFPGFFLYYPSQRQLPAALAALIETLRFGQEKKRDPLTDLSEGRAL